MNFCVIRFVLKTENVIIHDCVAYISAETRNLQDWVIGNRKTAAAYAKVSVVVASITRPATPCLTNEQRETKARDTWIFLVDDALNSEAPRAVTINQRSCLYGRTVALSFSLPLHPLPDISLHFVL